MSFRTALFILGLILTVLPFPVLGFPQSWKNIFYIIAGLLLALGTFISYIRAHTPSSHTPLSQPKDVSDYTPNIS